MQFFRHFLIWISGSALLALLPLNLYSQEQPHAAIEGVCDTSNFWNDGSGFGFPAQAYGGDLNKLAERLEAFLKPAKDDRYTVEPRLVVNCDGELVYCKAFTGKKQDPVIGEQIESVLLSETDWLMHTQVGDETSYVDYEFIYFVEVKKGQLTLNAIGG